MTIAELKAALDDYGDDVPVVLVIERGQHEYAAEIDDVGYTTRFDEPAVTLTGNV